jgi:hypothetical protein
MAAAAFPPDGTVGDLATGDLALVARRAAARTIDTVLLFATLLAASTSWACGSCPPKAPAAPGCGPGSAAC